MLKRILSLGLAVMALAVVAPAIVSQAVSYTHLTLPTTERV